MTVLSDKLILQAFEREINMQIAAMNDTYIPENARMYYYGARILIGFGRSQHLLAESECIRFEKYLEDMVKFSKVGHPTRA